MGTGKIMCIGRGKEDGTDASSRNHNGGRIVPPRFGLLVNAVIFVHVADFLTQMVEFKRLLRFRVVVGIVIKLAMRRD
jgi:hypothetical protein